MRLAQIPNRVAQLAEQYEVPERLNDASRKIYQGMNAAGATARRGALAAYHTALEHPRASIGGIILAAALVGGVLWYVFSEPLAKRKKASNRQPRAKARTQRRSRARAQAAA